MSCLTSIFFCLFILPSAVASQVEQVAEYTLHMLGTSVGSFVVTQSYQNETICVDAITDVEVRLLITYRIKYVQHTVYKHGVLQHSEVETYKNGNLNSTMHMKLTNTNYLLVADGDTSVVQGPITYSGSLLYFNEPAGVDSIYNERAMEMRAMQPAGEHEFIITDRKNKELNRYQYENGILQHARMKHTLGNLELKRLTKEKQDD